MLVPYLRLCVFVILFGAPALGLAQTTTYIQLQTGTGFVVNTRGDVVTNAHVVRGCESISILTRSGEEAAEILAEDSAHDLAVLHTRYRSPGLAPLRRDVSTLRVGDAASVIGYPGQHAITGRAQLKKTRITSLRGSAGETHLLQLNRVVTNGSSGSPVLDAAGYVIGVISGMSVTYLADADGSSAHAPVAQADIAITLPALKEFLGVNGIALVESSTAALPHAGQIGHDFIVPVRCVKGAR